MTYEFNYDGQECRLVAKENETCTLIQIGEGETFDHCVYEDVDAALRALMAENQRLRKAVEPTVAKRLSTINKPINKNKAMAKILRGMAGEFWTQVHYQVVLRKDASQFRDTAESLEAGADLLDPQPQTESVTSTTATGKSIAGTFNAHRIGKLF